MFRCQKCDKVTEKHQPMNKAVIETRDRTYETEIKRGKMRGTMRVTKGSEIVKEISVCPDCYTSLTGLSPRVTDVPVVVPSKPRFENKPNFRKDYQRRPWRNRNNQRNNQSPQTRSKPIVETVKPLAK